MTILTRLTEIIEDVIDDEYRFLPETERDWDSIAQIQIIYAIENEFSVKLSITEIEKFNQLSTVGQMHYWIESKVVS